MGVFKARVFSKKRHGYRVVLVFKKTTKWAPVVLIFGLMASSCALADITSAATEPSGDSIADHYTPELVSWCMDSSLLKCGRMQTERNRGLER